MEGTAIAVQINLLGRFLLRSQSGEELTIPSRKGQALLAVLALSGGEPVSRERLMSLLWSDRGEKQARSSLRQVLTELRKLFSDLDPPPLITTRDTVRIDPANLEVDVVTFEHLIESGTAEELAEASALYRGELLDGLDVRDTAFEDWLRTERQRFRIRTAEALGRLLELQTGDAAMATAQRLLALDSLNEAAHRALMRLYAEAGDRSAAMKQHDCCRKLLEAELGVAPDKATERLAEEIRSGATCEDGASGRTSAPPHALPLPDKPSVAVLPFVNLSGDPEQDYFAEGLTEDVITQLARFRSLFVIHSTSSLPYKGETPKVQEVSHALGVAYVARGSVRKIGNRVRIVVALVEAASGWQLWTERYDRDLEDIFAIQDEVASKMASTLAGHIDDTDRQRAARNRSGNLAAYELVLLGEQAERDFTKDGVLRARALFQKALERDPGNARAHASMARTFLDELWAGWSTDWDAAAELAFDWSQKAVALDELDNRARTNLGVAYSLCKRNFEAAQVQFARAQELNPNDADAYCLQGWCHVYAGEPDEVIACTDRSMRLTPFAMDDCLKARFHAHYMARRYAEALESLSSLPNPSVDIEVLRAACYAQLGQDDYAQHALEIFLSEAPDEIAEWPGEDPKAWRRHLAKLFRFHDRRNFEHLLDGFRKAGLPI